MKPSLSHNNKSRCYRQRTKLFLRGWIYSVLMLLAVPSVWAVEMGSPSIRSFLGQNLDVRINVIDGNDKNMQGALVSLAPLTEWVRAGVTLLPDNLTLQVSFVEENGNIFVALQSQQPVREPVLQVLLSLQVTGQELQSKPFILFLDPLPQANSRPRTIGSSRATFGQSADSSPANNARTITAPPAARSSSAAVSSTPARSNTGLSSGTYGPVREGETLWSIAERISRDVGFTPQQILIALQQANPNALEDPANVNTLRSDVLLTLPDTSSLARTDREQALVLIEQQNQAWQSSGRGARLELLRGGEDSRIGIDGGGDNILALRLSRLEEELIATRRENEALREQVGQLENTLTERESEISISNSTLARLQQQLEQPQPREADADLAQADNSAASGIAGQADNQMDGEVGDQLQSDDGSDQTGLAGIDPEASVLALDFSGQSDQLAPQGAEVSADNDMGPDENVQRTLAQDPATPAADDFAGGNASTAAQDGTPTDSPVAESDSSDELGADEARWSWPIWESAGWRDLQNSQTWLPRGATGFALLLVILLLLIALPVVVWLLLRGVLRNEPAESSDLLDRLVTQSSSRKAALSEQREADALAAAKLFPSEPDEHADDELGNEPGDDLAEQDSAADDDVSIADSDSDTALSHAADLEAEDIGEPAPDQHDDELEADWLSEDDEQRTPDEDIDSVPVINLDEDDDDEDLESALNAALESDSDDAELESEHGVTADELELADELSEAESDDDLFGTEQIGADEDESVELQDHQPDDLKEGDLAVDADALPDADDIQAAELTADDTLDTSSHDQDPVFDELEENPVDEAIDESVQEPSPEIASDIPVETAPLRPNEADRLWSRQAREQSPDEAEETPAKPAMPADEHSLDDPFSASLADPPSPDSEQQADPEEPVQSSLYDDDSIDVKLDLARAYLAMGDREAMSTILDEIGASGSAQQRQEVQQMRDQLAD